MITTAVIMAAGKGTRFGERTSEMPKGFIEFKGRSMIERSIENLLTAGITKIIIGTGYQREWYEQLAKKYPEIRTVFSVEFADSNSMETLYICKETIGNEDFLLLESDIIYGSKAINQLLECKYPNVMLAADITKFQDQYYIGVDSEGFLNGCSVNKDAIIDESGAVFGELVGIHKISHLFFNRMVDDYKTHREEYLKRGYEFEIEDIAKINQDLFVLKLPNLQWYEIDDEKDLNFAEQHISID